MAVAFVQSIGTATIGTNHDQPFITTTADALVGQRIVFFWTCLENVTVNSGQDNAGNTYTIDVQSYDGLKIAIVSAQVTTQLNSGQSVWVNLSAEGTWHNMHAATFSGIATSSMVDSSNAVADDSASPSTTSTAASTNDSVIVGAFSHRSATDYSWTAGGSATAIAETFVSGGVNFASQRRVLAASGSYNSSGTWSGSALDGIAAHVIYKGAGGGTNATVTAAVGTATASVVAPPLPRPTPPFTEINVRM